MSECNCSCSGNCASNEAVSNVYACAGASNVGKISLDLAIALHLRNSYSMGCASGVGADICGFKEAAVESKTEHLLIDGCPVSCLKKMFASKGITNFRHIIVTTMGVVKEPVFDYDPQIIEILLDQIESEEGAD